MAIEGLGKAFSDAVKQEKDVLIDRKSKESTKELIKCLRNELEKERGECRKDKAEAEKQRRVEAEEQRRGYEEKLRKEKVELEEQCRKDKAENEEQLRKEAVQKRLSWKCWKNYVDGTNHDPIKYADYERVKVILQSWSY